MCWWKGILKTKRKARREAGTLFSTRQVHLPNIAFGFSSCPVRSLKLLRYVRLHPPNEPCGHHLKLQRDLSWWVRGRLFWTFEKDKAPEKHYPGRCASAWAQPSESTASGLPFLLPPSCSLVLSSSWPSCTLPNLMIWWPHSGSLSWVLPLGAALGTGTGKVNSEDLVAMLTWAILLPIHNTMLRGKD